MEHSITLDLISNSLQVKLVNHYTLQVYSFQQINLQSQKVFILKVTDKKGCTLQVKNVSSSKRIVGIKDSQKKSCDTKLSGLI